MNGRHCLAIVLLTLLALAALIAPLGSSASAQAPSTLEVTSVQGEAGQVAVVPVKASLDGVAGLRVDLAYDPGLATLEGVSPGPLLAGFDLELDIDEDRGRASVAASSPSEVSGEGTALELYMEPTGSPGGAAPVRITSLDLTDGQGTAVPSAATDGRVEIAAAPAAAETVAASSEEESADSLEGVFRMGPTARLRPVNDVVDRDRDGIVEVFLRNPSLNDVAMMVDLTVSVPSGLHVYGEGFGTGSAAGTVSGTFRAPPGTDRTVSMNVKGERTGDYTIHFSGLYYPEGNKDLFNPISLTHSLTVKEPSPEPESPAPTNPEQAREGQPRGVFGGCNPASVAAGSSMAGMGDLGLLALTLAGLLAWRRRPRG